MPDTKDLKTKLEEAMIAWLKLHDDLAALFYTRQHNDADMAADAIVVSAMIEAESVPLSRIFGATVTVSLRRQADDSAQTQIDTTRKALRDMLNVTNLKPALNAQAIAGLSVRGVKRDIAEEASIADRIKKHDFKIAIHASEVA